MCVAEKGKITEPFINLLYSVSAVKTGNTSSLCSPHGFFVALLSSYIFEEAHTSHSVAYCIAMKATQVATISVLQV